MENLIKPNHKLLWYKFSTVSEPEIEKLLSRPKFQLFFREMNEMARIDGFPQIWLISSIDKSAADDRQRTADKPGNHYDSRAIDIVPLSILKDNKMVIRLPIPLNRNLLLMSLFRETFEKHESKAFPVIMFEADHIHIDVNHLGQVFYLNTPRSPLDRRIFNSIKNPINRLLGRAIGDNSYRSLTSVIKPIEIKEP